MYGWMDPWMMAWMCLIHIYNQHPSKDVFPCVQKIHHSIRQIKYIIYISMNICIYVSIIILDDARTPGLGVENIFRSYSHQLSITCWKIPHHSEAVNNSNLGHMASEMASFMHPVTRFFKVTILVFWVLVFVPLKWHFKASTTQHFHFLGDSN